VSEDEASWVVTTYLVSNAVILTASSFLARMLGRKTFFLICLALFTASSVLCGLAWSLHSLLLFRILQGLGGGGMVPVSQSILADSFPQPKRGQAFALFGVAVVVAPIVGPTLGGWLSDNYSWHWCFLINGPVGLVAIALIAFILRDSEASVEQRRRLRQQGAGFDLIGFVLVATFLGALEVMLDRGLEDDWFASSFIVAVTVVCALAFVLMIPWEISRRNPMIDLRMVATRQFGACFLVMLATGAILLSTTQFLPLLVQQDFGYTATWAGLVLSPGGLVTMVMMFVAGRLVAKVQPKSSMRHAGSAEYDFAQGKRERHGRERDQHQDPEDVHVGQERRLHLYLLSDPLDGLLPCLEKRTSVVHEIARHHLINAARNIGGSIGISLASNVLAHREQFRQSRLVENVIPSSAPYQHTLQLAEAWSVLSGGMPW
jgi:DHA2 family multidrug resistance protein